jgi:GNAT superfamily N-acetyltransferase
MEHRVATSDDIDAVTETIRLAFDDDPVWGPALTLPDGSTDHLTPFWRIYVEGGMRFSTVFVVGEPGGVVQTVAVWTPPGESELSEEQDAEITNMINTAFPAGLAAKLLELYDRFEAAHPHDAPHAYLGLLATHPDYRGRGIGQQLLAANLADLDDRGVPAYLESTNPANLHRYVRAGFEPSDEFVAVLDGAPITTMWRQPKP